MKDYIKILKKKNIKIYWFLLIPLIIYVVFFIIPNIESLRYSFFKWAGIGPKIFVGLKNYINLFNSPIFLLTLKNTVIYTILLMIGQNILGFLIATFIYKEGRIHNIIRTIVFLPIIMSSVAIGFIWTIVYDPAIGAINTFLNYIGLGNFTRLWVVDPKLALFSIVIMHIWAQVGYSMMIYINGLLNISKELYEAANIDGANKFQTIFYITIPLLKNSILTSMMFTTILGFVTFDFIYIMTRGGNDHSSEVLAMLLFKEGFQYSNFGGASSIAIVLIILIFFFAIIQMVLLRERNI